MQNHQQEFLRAATELVAKLSATVDSISVRNEHSTDVMQKSAVVLHDKIEGTQTASEEFVRQVINAIVARAPAAMEQGIGEAVGEYRQSMEDCKQKAQWACEAMGEQRKYLSLAQSMRVWIGVAGAVLFALAVWGVTGYMSWENGQEIARKKQELAQLTYQEQAAQALAARTVVPCGDGDLCGKIAKGAPRYGAHGEYVQLQRQ